MFLEPSKVMFIFMFSLRSSLMFSGVGFTYNLTTKYKKLPIGKGSRKKSYFLNGIAIKALLSPSLMTEGFLLLLLLLF